MIILSQAVWLQYPVCVLSPGVRIPVSRAQAEVWCLQCHRFMWSDVIFMWRQHERMLPTPSKPRSRIPICNNSFMTKYQNSADSPDYKTYHTLDEDAENTYLTYLWSTILYCLIDKVPRFLELGWMVCDGGQGKYHGGYLILTSSVFQCWGVVYCWTGPWWAVGEGIKMCGTYQDNSTTQTFLSSKIYGKNSTGQGSINQYNSNCFKNDKMRYVCAGKYILKYHYSYVAIQF